jgi:hypothetical protein
MNKLISFLGFSLVVAAASVAQPGPQAAPAPGPQSGPTAQNPTSPATSMTAQHVESYATMKDLDAAMKDLSAEVDKFPECGAEISYLKKDLAETKARVQGAKDPNAYKLIVAKSRRLAHQVDFCYAKREAISARFSAFLVGMRASTSSDPTAIPQRRQKLFALHSRFDALAKTVLHDAAPGKSAGNSGKSDQPE